MTTDPNPRCCLVTGGAGFIGSHLAQRLLARGDRLIIVDNLSTGRQSNLDGLDPQRVQFINSTVSEAIRSFTTGQFDEIYHLAAAVGVRLVIEQPIQTIETNILETGAILEYAASAETPTLLASTSEVYGKSTKTPFAEDDELVYGPTRLHRWSYACSKAIDEYLALAYGRERGLPVSIVRFFNTVGPRQLGSYGMVLPRFVAAALEGQPLLVHGDGQQTRCFCDVRDVVELLPTMLTNPRCLGTVLNVGSDESISILALAQRVVSVVASPSPIRLIPYDEAFGEGFDDLRDRQPDLTRLREATGFERRLSLDQTIRDIADELRRRRPDRTEHAQS